MYATKIHLLVFFLTLMDLTNSRSVSTRYKRMINGQLAKIKNWSFIASIKYSASSRVIWKVCSASLISRDWLVTVGHCVKDQNEVTVNVEDLKVQLRPRNDSWQTEDYEVSQIIAHPLENPGEFFDGIENDIALIKLKENAPEHMTILQMHKERAGNVRNCRSAGWGSKSQLQNGQEDVIAGNYTVSNSLQSIAVSHLTAWNNCDFLSSLGQGINFNRSRKFFCGGETGVTERNGQYGCIGDSGSPLICENNFGPALYGLLDGGNPRCIPGSTHMVFIDVSKHRKWINEVMHSTQK